MDHIKKYNNNIDLDKLSNVFDKYKRSGYLSKSSINSLPQGFGKSIQSLIDKVESCLEFYRNQDIQLLRDLMIYLKDDFDEVSCITDPVYYVLDVLPSRGRSGVFGQLKNFDVSLSTSYFDGVEDINRLTKFDSVSDICVNIFNRIKKSYEYELSDARSWGSHSDWFKKASILRLEQNNHFEDLTITPTIKICLNTYHGERPDYFYNRHVVVGSDEYIAYNNYNSKKYKSIEDIKNYFKDEILYRYLSSIGYDASNSELSYSDSYLKIKYKI